VVEANGKGQLRDPADDEASVSDGSSVSDQEEYDSSDEGDGSDNGDNLNAAKYLIFKQIWEDLKWSLPATPSLVRSCTSTDSSCGSQQAAHARTGSRSQRGARGSAGKDANNDRNIDPSDDGGEGGGRGGRSVVPASTLAVINFRRYACCFYKHNPQKYRDVRPCSGPGFRSVHRLKYVIHS